MESRYHIINNLKELRTLIEYCKVTGYASIDFETNGYPFHSSMGRPTILSVSFQPGSGWVIPLAHKDSIFLKNNKWLEVLKEFGKEVISNKDIIKVAWNAKFEYKWFKKYDIPMVGRVFDGMLAKYLLSEERPNGLKDMVARFLPDFAGYDLKGQPGPKAKLDQIVRFWSNVEIKELSKYGSLDADSTLRLMLFFEDRLIKGGFYNLFRNMMMMATRVLGDSEFHGINIDTEYLDSLREIYSEKIKESDYKLRAFKEVNKFNRSLVKERLKIYIESIYDEIEILEEELDSTYEQKIINSINKKIKTRKEKISKLRAGNYSSKKEAKLFESINFSSPQQMGQLLFTSRKGFKYDVLRYTEDKKTKKQSENPSTDESVLEELLIEHKHPFLEELLNYRKITKLNSTYVVGMWDLLSEEGRVHSNFLLHGTVTGRLSSREPNLQNIPRDTTASDIKKMFVPSGPGRAILQLDYSQAELRVMAAQAKEKNMIKWFRDGRDIHLAVACNKNNWEYDWALAILNKEDKVDKNFTKVKTERKFSKTINFGIIYGQTSKKLSINLECSKEEADDYLVDYNKQFPRIAKFIKEQHRFVQRNGYVKNVFGRKRRLPNVFLPMETEQQRRMNWGKVAEAQRQSVNAPIQGAASDYALFSSILIWEKIQSGELPRDMAQIFTVHDSLGYDIAIKDIPRVVPILASITENPETLEWFGFQLEGVRMLVDFETSEVSWKDLSKYHVN